MTAVKERPRVNDVTTVKFGDREVQAVVEHVGSHGWVLARIMDDIPDVPCKGVICAKRI